MTAPSHTPGPWHVREFDGSIGGIDGVGDMPIAQAMQLRPIYIEPAQDERRANTRLIAAAPELLDALKEARASIFNLADKDEIPEEWAVIGLIDAAIAKATQP